MKIGRNDPCPCGSGRKYKNCHLRSVDQAVASDDLWQRLHSLSLRLPADLLRFVKGQYGTGLIDEAWREFTLYEEESFDADSVNLPLFLPWFFHEWDPDPEETMLSESEVSRFPVASAYLQRRARYEDPLAVRYLTACCDSAFSFLDLVNVRPGVGLTVRDSLTGWEGSVIERTASQTLRKGDIIFAKVVSVDDVNIFDGCAPISFPPREKPAVIELRKKMRKANPSVTVEVLKDYRLEMLEVYHEIADRLLNPRLPELANTDGEPMVFCRVTYEIPSPRAAFDALQGLSLGHTEDDLLADAGIDAAGELQEVEIPWLKEGNAHFPWQNTGMGWIKIAGGRLVAEVNSEARAKQFRAIADKLLPAGSRHVSTVLEPVEAALKAYREEGSRRADEDLNERPEVQALIKEQLRAHYRAWPDMELPALNGKTPRQAVKTKDGREMVEALLLDFEQRSEGQSGLDEEILAELRSELGLR